jgi:hypothetical protein
MRLHDPLVVQTIGARLYLLIRNIATLFLFPPDERVSHACFSCSSAILAVQIL